MVLLPAASAVVTYCRDCSAPMIVVVALFMLLLFLLLLLLLFFHSFWFSEISYMFDAMCFSSLC
jgi:hypothetical protein